MRNMRSVAHIHTTVGFIGVGNMGSGMIQNLAKTHNVLAYDSNPNWTSHIKSFSNITKLDSVKEVAKNAQLFVTMLPNDKIVSQVCDDIFEHAKKRSLILDSSTISPFAAQDLNKRGAQANQRFIDSPVSGGVGAAAAGTLTFMVGTDDNEIFELCKQVLGSMGKNVIKCNKIGGGQIAKICNNMALGIEMVAVAEALSLGQKLGMDSKLLTEVMKVSSSRCWSLDTYNPAPGVMENVPASRNYEGGFASELMLKDLSIAKSVAEQVNASVPLGNQTFEIYSKIVREGKNRKDFSIIFDELINNRI